MKCLLLSGLLCLGTTAVPQYDQTAEAPAPAQKPKLGGAMRVLSAQKDLETAIRVSKRGDILVYNGAEGWYRIDGKSLQQGTRVFVLGQGSLVSMFPKEQDADSNLR